MENKKIKQFISTLQTIAKELDEETSTPEVAEKTKATEAPAEITAEAASVVPYSEASETDAEHCYKSFELPDNILVQVDILKKSRITLFDYFSGANAIIGLKLMHTYKPNNINSVYGKDFGLSINERLIGSIYIDGIGDRYILNNGYIAGMKYSTVPPQYVKGFENLTWLFNGTIAKGFNSDGYLVVVYDINNNYIKISYDAENKVTEVQENKVTEVQDNSDIINYIVCRDYIFKYLDKSLIYIEDSSKKRVSFKYNNGYLTEITYPDGRTLTLSYDSNLMTISSSDGYIHKINSDIKIITQSSVSKIPDGDESTSLPNIINWQITLGGTVTIKDIDGNCEYYKFTNNGMVSEYCKEEHSVVTYADKRFYSENLKDGKVVYRNTRVFIASDSILNRTPYDNFNYSINYSLDECRSTSYNQLNNPVSESLSNKRLEQDSYLSYSKSYMYNEDNLLKNVSTTYCLYTIDDGEELDHQYYHYIIDCEYSKNKLIKRSYFEETKTTKGQEVEEYEYDDAGQITKIISYNSLEDTKVFITEKTYDQYGRLKTETDSSGLRKLEYIYMNSVAKPYCVILPNKCAEYHYFDDRHRTNQVVLFNGGEKISNENLITYDSDETVRYSDESSTINFSYDDKRQLSKVAVNAGEYFNVSYNLKDSNGNLLNTQSITLTNAKGETFTLEEDKTHTYTSYKYGDDTEFTTTYRNHKYVDTVNDNVSGETVKYNYDNANVLWWYTVTENGAEKYRAYFVHNDDGRVSTVTQSGVTDISYGYYYENGFYGNLNKVRVARNTDVVINYDKLGRYTGRKVTYNNTPILTESIEYDQVSTTLNPSSNEARTVYRQSNLPSKIGYGNGSYSYTYDVSGNITKIVDGNGKQILYTYDKANRLIREDNQPLNRTYLITYDSNGNILSKTEHFYNDTTIPYTSLKYKYSGGKLLQINQELPEIYDAMGNPTQYRGNALAWTKGNCLGRFKNTTFKYDGRGRRIYKNNTRYYYDYNDRLIASSDGMQYFYDHNGVAGFKYGGAFYYYQRDIQNNVTAILDSNGTVVVKYTYNAWGYHTVSDTSGNSLGTKNPFRYRSYFYDTETKLYYLKTRFYDPEVGRFLNMDSVQYADPEKINGLNLYVYCNNNPVNFIDPTGYIAIEIVIGLFSLFAIVATAYIENEYHLIQDTVEDIGNAIGNFANDLYDYIKEIIDNNNSYDLILNLPTSDSNDYSYQVNNILYYKNFDPDPFGRPNQKKRGRENKNKSRKSPNWEPRNGYRRPKLPKSHRPGREHRKYMDILELLTNLFF